MKPVKQDVGAPVEFSQMPYDPQLGDYPQLPAVSRQWRQPGDQWWDKQDRRNFGEPVHEQDEVLTVWAPDVYPVSGPSAIFQFSMACLVFTAFGVILSFVRPDRPAVPREYPYNGLAEHLGGEINKANTAEDEE
ncbi:hypothetical protein DACRYDRAFT_20508 [Dacryopinax primogenitus]|uniref:Uncharacterized protein n=1 Tax=Dacryopinax primogenitus (strain DJM 731) TaxID=1858805 RepID=M5GDY1_DACPD|nr:uncharacterized protein DACRYDRAFT_20508 [Dacryopinax primogenitus]EJU04922.1 hypothetical protein DACRYDRAFT_20508 [Dacryopinax primogenitus]